MDSSGAQTFPQTSLVLDALLKTANSPRERGCVSEGTSCLVQSDIHVVALFDHPLPIERFRLHGEEHAGESAPRGDRGHRQFSACGYHRHSMSAFDATMDRIDKNFEMDIAPQIEEQN